MRVLLTCLLVAACSKAPEPTPEPSWKPGTVYRTERARTARGLLDRRGLIHSHSHFSHDACDGMPVDDAGVRDEKCLDDFRNGLCLAGHDFAFLTDHRDAFDDYEFPDVLLYRPAKGDQLVDHGQGPTANRISCPGGDSALVMGGNESEMMPVGLERHAEGRGATYGDESDAGIAKIHAAGGLAIMAHTEKRSAEELIAIGYDGFEMYNLHANTFKNLAIAADWALKCDAKMFDGLPDPNIFLIGFQLEDPAYLQTWGTVLARGVRRVTTMGTDCHRNSLPSLAQDNERIDSYRRMMAMFSNHLLVTPKSDGSFDDRDLKAALAAGRLYGSFDFLGYPEGFDFVARAGGKTHEMGSEVPAGAVLEITRPTVQRMSKESDAAVLSVHLFKARESGWDEVAVSADGNVTFTAAAAGAYRAEVRMVPSHLKPFAGRRLDLLKAARPWIYSNAIYVR